MSNAVEPSRCPTCGVLYPAACRNGAGSKIWPPHRAHVAATSKEADDA